MTRWAKIALMAACALHWAIVVWNNLVDHPTNLAFVQHVLNMDTVFPANRGSGRAISSPPLQHLAYWTIILWESLAGALCAAGAYRMARLRRAAPEVFRQATDLAVAGLTAVLLLFFSGFLSIGGEWFMMWQSTEWNGVDPAGRLFAVHALILLFVHQPEAGVRP